MSHPRLQPITPGSRPQLQPQEARILASRGRITPLYQVLLHSPAIVEGWEALLTAVRQKTRVPPALRELVILRIATLNGAPYEFEAHVPHARQAGLPQVVIDTLRQSGPSQTPALADPLQADVLAYTDAMTLAIDVPDAIYDPLAARFDDQVMLELTATIAAYNMVSRLLAALRIGH